MFFHDILQGLFIVLWFPFFECHLFLSYTIPTPAYLLLDFRFLWHDSSNLIRRFYTVDWRTSYFACPWFPKNRRWWGYQTDSIADWLQQDDNAWRIPHRQWQYLFANCRFVFAIFAIHRISIGTYGNHLYPHNGVFYTYGLVMNNLKYLFHIFSWSNWMEKQSLFPSNVRQPVWFLFRGSTSHAYW